MLKRVHIVGFAILVILWLSGCRATQLAEGGIFGNQADNHTYEKPQLVDYALASNGAKIKCSKASRGHQPGTVINGITDSEAWDKGEGWECQFSLTAYYRPGYGYYSYWWYDYRGRPHWPWDWELDKDESAWIEVLFPRRIKIDRVVVHTYFSKKRVQHGLGEALLQSWTGDRWTNLAEVRKGYIYSPTPSKPNRGRYEFNFVPVETDKLRLLVLRGDKKSTRKLQIGGGRTVEEHWARIVEIEATGTDTAMERLQGK
jgi:hypothetical protein